MLPAGAEAAAATASQRRSRTLGTLALRPTRLGLIQDTTTRPGSSTPRIQATHEITAGHRAVSSNVCCGSHTPVHRSPPTPWPLTVSAAEDGGSPPAPPRHLLARRFHPQFRDKNRRDIGKSQSTWTDSKIETARSPSSSRRRRAICASAAYMSSPVGPCSPEPPVAAAVTTWQQSCPSSARQHVLAS
jgi:hypothetical protein